MSICKDCIHLKVCAIKEKCQELEDSIKSDEKNDAILTVSVSCKHREKGYCYLPSHPFQPSIFKSPPKTPCERTITWYKTTDSADAIDKTLDELTRGQRL